MLGITIRAVLLVLATSLVVACSSTGGAGGSGGMGGVGGVAGSGGNSGSGGSSEPEFEEFVWRTDTPDGRVERLCAAAAAPDDAPDTTFIACDIEGATFSSEEPPAKDELVVLAYNILRGFDVDDQLDMILDIILPRGVEVTNAGRCPPERCGSLSDHLPVFAEVRGVLGQ